VTKSTGNIDVTAKYQKKFDFGKYYPSIVGEYTYLYFGTIF
jgi:hypothetical protein